MPTKTKRRKVKPKAAASFYYRGVKITPMRSLNSRFARAIRRALEERDAAMKGEADPSPSE